MPTAVDSLKPRTESTPLTTSLFPKILERWHLLSLDAPTVAALWSWFFARSMHISLPWHAPLILAVGTWLIYVADRTLDGTRATSPLRERHRFHLRHRRGFLAAVIPASILLIWLIVTRMTPNARYEDTLLFAAALLYLLAVHKPYSGSTNWLPKELAVGIVFAAATAVPAWSRLTGPLHQNARATLLPSVATFAALCWLNCVAIERWENKPATEALESLGTHISTRWAARHFRRLTLGLAAISAALASISVALNSPTLPLYLAAMTAALCLAATDHLRENLSSLHLRVAADAALLTPIILIPLLR